MNEHLVKDFETLTLERLKVAYMQQASSYVVRNADIRVVSDILTDQLVARLESHVMADRLEPSDGAVTFVVWASTWQHVKASLFPTFSRWLRRPPRKRPVRVPITAQNFTTFPTCRTDYPPDLGRPVRLSWVQEAYWLDTTADPLSDT